jgi:hypothetical protein
MSNGNPIASRSMIERRAELLKRLKESPVAEHKKVIAMFAVETGTSEKTVQDYYKLFSRAGLI